MQDIENGHRAVKDAIALKHAEDGVTLPQSVVRRLARLQARAEGASQVAQAAMMAAQQAQQAVQTALTEACEDEGMQIPQGTNAPVEMDWRTGHVKLAAMPTPMAPPEILGPAPEPDPVTP